jgi:hypothetical protein
MNVDRKTHVGYPCSLRVSGPSSAPQTSRYPTSTSTNLSRTQEAGWPSIRPPRRAAGATEDVMTAYLPTVLGQDVLQWL